MCKYWFLRSRPGVAIAVCVLLVALIAPQPLAHSRGVVPIPAVKPNVHNTNGKVVSYSLKDLGKALLGRSTSMPYPSSKPSSELNKTKASKSFGILSSADAQRYNHAFTLQADGKMQDAKHVIRKIKNKSLMGHILYQKYTHPTAYTSSAKELKSWLKTYDDHPHAQDIYDLALKKSNARKSGLVEPQKTKFLSRLHDPMMKAQKSYPMSAHAKTTMRSVKRLLKSARYDDAVDLIHQEIKQNTLSQNEYSTIVARIAQNQLQDGHVSLALKLSSDAANRAGLNAPNAGWIAGLASWKTGDHKSAAKYFEMTALSPYSSPWTAAAGAYWASRSYAANGKIQQRNRWLSEAAKHHRTFYGLIAARTLKSNIKFNWNLPRFTQVELNILKEIPRAARAIALVEAGQNHLAQAEMIRLRPKNKTIHRALLAYAGHASLPAITMRLGGSIQDTNGRTYDAAFYPKGNWSPTGGYLVDPTLIHAIIRQESLFDHQAKSPSGAKGLMQVMPRTADFVAKRINVNLGQSQNALYNPPVNLAIGQSYITHLMGQNSVNGDIMSLLVAYNGGPGNLRKWKKQWNDVDDPLLFIELIPLAETRAYVERVLSNYWIYRLRENKKTPMLEALAFNKNVRYVDRTKQVLKVAGL